MHTPIAVSLGYIKEANILRKLQRVVASLSARPPRHLCDLSALVIVLLFVFTPTAVAQQNYSAGFAGNALPPEMLVLRDDAGFGYEIDAGVLTIVKSAGTRSGFLNIGLGCLIDGDFDIQVVATRSAQNNTGSIGLLARWSGQGPNFVDVFFSNATFITANMFRSGHGSQFVSQSATNATFRIRRTGTFVSLEYNVGSGFVTLNSGAGSSLAGPVRLEIFAGEESNNSAAWMATYDDVAVAAAVLVPVLVLEPSDASACLEGTAPFSVIAAGSGPYTYQWEINDPMYPGEWRGLGNDPGPLPGGGTAFAFPINSPTVAIGVRDRVGVFGVRCIVSNTCGSVNTDSASLGITNCATDVNCDGIANSADFFDFLTAFFNNAPTADFNSDTIVNSQDFFDFLGAFFSGC